MDQKILDFLNTYDSFLKELKAVEQLIQKAETDLSAVKMKYFGLLADFSDVEKFVKRQKAIDEKEKEDLRIATLLKDIESGFDDATDKVEKLRKLDELRRAQKITGEQFKGTLSKVMRKKGLQSKPDKV